MLQELLWTINISVLLGNAFVVYKLTPIYREYLRHLQSEQDLTIQKVELLTLDLKNRLVGEQRFVYNE